MLKWLARHQMGALCVDGAGLSELVKVWLANRTSSAHWVGLVVQLRTGGAASWFRGSDLAARSLGKCICRESVYRGSSGDTCPGLLILREGAAELSLEKTEELDQGHGPVRTKLDLAIKVSGVKIISN